MIARMEQVMLEDPEPLLREHPGADAALVGREGRHDPDQPTPDYLRATAACHAGNSARPRPRAAGGGAPTSRWRRCGHSSPVGERRHGRSPAARRRADRARLPAARIQVLPEAAWAPIDRLVYFVLFPASLLKSWRRADLAGVPVGGWR